MKILLSLIVLLAAQSGISQTRFDEIRFIQGNSVVTISQMIDSVSLKKEPFSIRYFCRPYNEKKQHFYAARIAVLPDTEFIYIDTGHHTKNIPFFNPGSGLAAGENNLYDAAIISSDGHHYLTYQHPDDKRVELVSKQKKLLELDWKVSAFFYNDEDIAIADLDMKHLYFVIFIDKNLDAKIDAHELKKVKVNFVP